MIKAILRKFFPKRKRNYLSAYIRKNPDEVRLWKKRMEDRKRMDFCFSKEGQVLVKKKMELMK